MCSKNREQNKYYFFFYSKAPGFKFTEVMLKFWQDITEVA